MIFMTDVLRAKPETGTGNVHRSSSLGYAGGMQHWMLDCLGLLVHPLATDASSRVSCGFKKNLLGFGVLGGRVSAGQYKKGSGQPLSEFHNPLQLARARGEQLVVQGSPCGKSVRGNYPFSGEQVGLSPSAIVKLKPNRTANSRLGIRVEALSVTRGEGDKSEKVAYKGPLSLDKGPSFGEPLSLDRDSTIGAKAGLKQLSIPQATVTRAITASELFRTKLLTTKRA